MHVQVILLLTLLAGFLLLLLKNPISQFGALLAGLVILEFVRVMVVNPTMDTNFSFSLLFIVAVVTVDGLNKLIESKRFFESTAMVCLCMASFGMTTIM